ncbi:MAG: bifunctional folylpolyglutamate synthase/dihydrofolate synthase [Bacteroidetes bacterium]|nr:bifunctional folylpolyglutamate synthase/dihydrofolate synthase [Bacteroidota bacterium]
MNYKQTIDYLQSQLPVFHRIGAAAYKANLDNTIKLSNHFGNPETKFPSIHIAGTNGKGSVSNLIASVLQQSGFKTGLTTSPHLRDFRERFRINGEMISEGYVIDFVIRNKEFFEKLKPSFFEMAISLAFEYFAKSNVDIAVVETGMGGRLDSTNIIKPEISIITNIGLDHTAFLGDTLSKIAFEKAGIIKPGIPILIGRKQKDTSNVFELKAKECKSELFYASDVCKLINAKTVFQNDAYYLEVNVIVDGEEKSYLCGLWGPYQTENIVIAIAAFHLLSKYSKFNVSENDIVEGLKNVNLNTGFEGRWQLKGTNPRVLFDTGHNIDGLSVTMSAIKNIAYERLHFVLGMVDDKDVNSTLKLLPKNAIFYFCKPDVPRGLNVESLHRSATEFGLSGKPYNSVREAFHDALKCSKTNDLVFVGGSTFVVAEVI